MFSTWLSEAVSRGTHLNDIFEGDIHLQVLLAESLQSIVGEAVEVRSREQVS